MLASRRLVAALTSLVLVPVLALSVAPPAPAAPAAAPDPLFTPMSGLTLGRDATVRPASFVSSRADLPALRSVLGRSGTVNLAIPDPSGGASDFTVAEDSVMAPALQAAHPETRTYRGTGRDGSSIRLDVTPFGFHAMVRRPDGKTWYVDPATRTAGESRVISYAGGAVPAPARDFVERDLEQAAPGAREAIDDFSTPGSTVTSRTYRLALLTDPTYAEYIAPGAAEAQSDALVLAAKTTLINRVNQVYNDDLGIRFELIDGTDTQLNLRTEEEATGADGPCGASPCFAAATGVGTPEETPGDLDFCDLPALNRMEFVTGQLVGAENFDIGHLGLGVNGGGVAGLGVVGGLDNPDEFEDGTVPGEYFNADKSAGCTGLPDPIGDFYAIDYVAHEMGHQMGSDHTFNGVVGACSGGNRDATPYDIQVEPGSGSSVMAYAGICGSDDLQPHSDPYFSFASNDVIDATTATTPAAVVERQVVDLADFTLGSADSFQLQTAAGTSAAITGANYSVATLEAAVQAATGVAGDVTPYDRDDALGADGFTVTWPASAGDVPTLQVVAATGVSGRGATIRNGGPSTNGGATAATTNRAPVVTAPADTTIPKQTPFTLTGAGTDADGDALTYLWEQTDAGGLTGTGLVDNTKVDGPLFRQFGTAAQVSDVDTLEYNSPGENLAGTSPSRTFPDLAQVVDGVTNAATGTCPAAPADEDVPIPQTTVDCYSEFLPTAAWIGEAARGLRVMHFRLTARDEFSADAAADHTGGSSSDEVALTVSPTAGPFLVTSRAAAGATASGAETVTWSVAGTAGLAANVRISLSTDGGVTFPTVLADSTPNDGSQALVLPAVTTDTARIKVEALGNYFFAVNRADFAIAPPTGNVAPLVDAGPDGSVAAGTAFTSTGSFSDEVPATARATVDYGDGTPATPLALTGTSFALQHTYTTPGTRTITVTVTDAAGAAGTDTVVVTVTGPVVQHVGDGKGTYTSPKGSSRARPQASGRTKLRFTADQTAAAISGSVKLTFRAGKVKFRSTAVTAVSTAGQLLSLSATGTNKGKAGYRLELRAKDTKKPKVRVRVFDGGKLVYDSMPGVRASKGPRTKFSGDINLG